MVSVPVFPHTQMSCLFYGLRVKKSWIVTCNYRVLYPAQVTWSCSLRGLEFGGGGEGKGVANWRQGSRCGVFRLSPLYQEAGNTVPPPSGLVVSDSFPHQPVRQGCGRLRIEYNPVGSSRYQSSEAEGVKCKVPGPNKPALSGKSLEPEESWYNAHPFSHWSPRIHFLSTV